MANAIALARRGLGLTWPSPSVGAVLVRPGETPEVVARGWTMPGGRPHAEAVALRAAGANSAGATLYVTLEPCAHKGRGGPCADIIAKAGVSRVVCAIGDPDPRTAGAGFGRLKHAGIEVVTGVGAEEARRVAAGHLLRVQERRPFVQLKLAVGSDGLIASGDGRPVWVTGEQARAQAHLLRARADAVLVGRGTIEADDPQLTCRLPGMEAHSPVRVVLDSELRIRPDAGILADTDRVPVWLMCTEAAGAGKSLARKGAEIIPVSAGAGGLDPHAVAGALAQRGITRLLVEGGPRVACTFLAAGLVDQFVLFQGTKPAGKKGLKPFVDAGFERIADSPDFTKTVTSRAGSDRMTVFDRNR